MRLVGVTSHAYDMSDCNETGSADTVSIFTVIGLKKKWWLDVTMAHVSGVMKKAS